MPTAETLSELNDLRKRIAELESELTNAQNSVLNTPIVPDLAPLDETVSVSGTFHKNSATREWSTKLTWRELFATIAPTLLLATNDASLRSTIADLLLARTAQSGLLAKVKEMDFDTIKVQLLAHDFITVQPLNTKSGGVGLFWQLTPLGKRAMIESRSIRKGEIAAAVASDV